jgi:WD40-like Beta Propeller Repeat
VKKSKVKAKIFTRLLYRHWNAFTEFKRSHLFVVSADVDATTGETPAGRTAGTAVLQPRDLTPGDHDVPPFHLGGQDMYAVSPDGQELAYTSNIDEIEATSTNNEIFIVPIAGGTAKKISSSPGSDNIPLYSPDGKYIAWRSQARNGFESDKQSLIVYDRKTKASENVTGSFDRSVGSFDWYATEPSLIFVAENHGATQVCGAFATPIDHETQVGCFNVDLHADDIVWSNKHSFLLRLFDRCA